LKAKNSASRKPGETDGAIAAKRGFDPKSAKNAVFTLTSSQNTGQKRRFATQRVQKKHQKSGEKTTKNRPKNESNQQNNALLTARNLSMYFIKYC